MCFENLDDGMYLIRQTGQTDNYEMESFLILIPSLNESKENSRNVEAHPKGETKKIDETTLIVNKVWKDNNNKKGKRPDSIEIGLYNNDVLVEKVTLSALNSWHYEWTDLEPSKEWTAKEIQVPDNYTSQATKEGTTVTITNTLSNASYEGGESNTGDNISLIYIIAFSVCFLGACYFAKKSFSW